MNIRQGGAILRLKEGVLGKRVEFNESEKGLTPQYYKKGIGNSPPKNYVPAEDLEYFDYIKGQWVPLTEYKGRPTLDS